MSAFAPTPSGRGSALMRIAKAIDVNLKVGSQLIEIVELQPGKTFVPLFVIAIVRTLTGGAITQSPTIRIGTNANHDNVAPLFAVPGSVVVGRVGDLPLASPRIAPDLGVAPIIFEVVQAAVGPTTMLGDLYLIGVEAG